MSSGIDQATAVSIGSIGKPFVSVRFTAEHLPLKEDVTVSLSTIFVFFNNQHGSNSSIPFNELVFQIEKTGISFFFQQFQPLKSWFRSNQVALGKRKVQKPD